MKIGFFITARLKSTRLKQKILLPLNGQAILDHVIERCKAVKGIDGVVLCTSTNSQDSKLYNYALKHQIEFYPGSEDDVLSRLEDASEYYGYDAFVSITADNPLHSIYIAQELISNYNKHNFDFIFTKGLPIGIAPYFIKTNALCVANFMKRETDTEIWGPFVNRPDFFNIGELHVINSPFKEKKRLTCDVKEDYDLFQALFSKFQNNFPDIIDVFNILEKNPDFWNFNQGIIQRGVSEEILTTINSNFEKMVKRARMFAKEKGIVLNPGLTVKKINI